MDWEETEEGTYGRNLERVYVRNCKWMGQFLEEPDNGLRRNRNDPRKDEYERHGKEIFGRNCEEIEQELWTFPVFDIIDILNQKTIESVANCFILNNRTKSKYCSFNYF